MNEQRPVDSCKPQVFFVIKKSLAVLFIFTIAYAQGQKLSRKAVVKPQISLVSIDATQCYEVNVGTWAGKEVVVQAAIDGEYYNDLSLNIVEVGTTLKVGTGFSPDFTIPNDKLGAHKVVSILLNVKLPRDSRLLLFGNSSNVFVHGSYGELDVRLNDGICRFNGRAERATVNSQSGDIYWSGPQGNIIAHSKFGSVSRNIIPKGDQVYRLNTVTGDIHLIKTE